MALLQRTVQMLMLKRSEIFVTNELFENVGLGSSSRIFGNNKMQSVAVFIESRQLGAIFFLATSFLLRRSCAYHTITRKEYWDKKCF